MPTYYYQFIQIRTYRPNIIMLIGGGAGVITSLVRIDGILRIPQDISDLSEESHF